MDVWHFHLDYWKNCSVHPQDMSSTYISGFGHTSPHIDLLLNDILSFSENDIKIASILDPSLGLRLSGIRLEDILFSDHPKRRYYEDGHYNGDDVVKCRENAMAYVREMLRLYVDGYIKNT